MDISEIKTSECSCDRCIEMCNHPCWGTPDDIKKIIDSGYGHKLMIDYWCDCTNGDIEMLCGALVGSEGRKAPWWPKGKCTFLTNENKCEIHEIKPFEGKVAICKGGLRGEKHQDLRKEIVNMWNIEEGKQLIEDWKKLVNY